MLKLRYIPKSLHEESVHNNYLMGLIFGTSRRVALTKKNSVWGYGFFKKGFKSNGFQVVVWSQNLRFSYFSFGLIFKRISSPKRARSARRAAKPRAGRAKRAMSGAAARSREAANTEAMYILAVCTQAFSASSLQYVSTPYFLVVDTRVVAKHHRRVDSR